MKQFLFIISICISSIVCSCLDENQTSVPDKETNGKCSVTFSLSKDDSSDFNVSTRSTGTVITDDYTVKFYLFERDIPSNEYRLVRKKDVTTPVFSLDDLTEDAEYKYVFVAIHNPSVDPNTSKVLDAIDFSSGANGDYNNYDYSITLPQKAAYIKNELSSDLDEQKGSLLENCFISFIDNTSLPTYGNDDTDDTDEVITIDTELEIFGTGAYFIPGSYSATIGVVMERQIGVVEFQYSDAQAGDVLTCSFSSDYYRLYLSQMVKDKSNPNYTSENNAVFSTPIADYNYTEYSTGDYYSALRVFKSTYLLPLTFKRTKTLGSNENSVKFYVPYTTAEAVGTHIGDDKYKANYIRTGLMGANINSTTDYTTGYITLQVNRGGTISTFKTDAPTAFPIYRNGKTIFTASNAGGLTINFGSGGTGGNDGGIHLPDDDIWNGDTN